jgi:hypothetical protein
MIMDTKEMLEYLKDLDKKYEKLNMRDFWVMCDTESFRPIKGLSEKELKEKLMNKPGHYGGRRIANVRIYVKDRKLAITENESLIHLIIQVFQIKEDGKLKVSGGVKTLLVLYFKEDLEKKKFRTKDAERFLKLCADGTLRSGLMNGMPYRDAIKQLHKKGITFEDV